MILNTVTLVGMDGAGNRPDITKAMQHSMKDIKFKKAVLLSPVTTYENTKDIELIKIRNLNYQQWNEFVVKELYKYITTDYSLFVDTDGFIINPHVWIDEFLNFDYIGARWWSNSPHHKYLRDEGIEFNPATVNNIGNGGFTLRSKKFLEEASKLEYDGHSPEDAFLCLKKYESMLSKGLSYAPSDTADQFSTDPYDGKSFGFHGNKSIISYL